MDKTKQSKHQKVSAPNSSLWSLFATCERNTTPSLLFWSLMQTELLHRSPTFQLFQTAPYGSISQAQLSQALRTSQNKGWARSTFLFSQQPHPGSHFQPGGLSKSRRSSLHLFSLHHIKHQLIASAFKVPGHSLHHLPLISYTTIRGAISRFWCRYDTNFHCEFFQLHIFILSSQPLHRHGQPSKPYHWIVPVPSSPDGKEVSNGNQILLKQGNPAGRDQMSQTGLPERQSRDFPCISFVSPLLT